MRTYKQYRVKFDAINEPSSYELEPKQYTCHFKTNVLAKAKSFVLLMSDKPWLAFGKQCLDDFVVEPEYQETEGKTVKDFVDERLEKYKGQKIISKPIIEFRTVTTSSWANLPNDKEEQK